MQNKGTYDPYRREPLREKRTAYQYSGMYQFQEKDLSPEKQMKQFITVQPVAFQNDPDFSYMKTLRREIMKQPEN